MRSINRVVLLGRLVEAPSGASNVCNFTLQTTEHWVGKNGPVERVTQHQCTAFSAGAETMRKAAVGGYVYVEGVLRCSDPNGGVAVSDEVVCFVAIPVAEQSEVPA